MKTLELDCCTMSFYDKYVLCIIKEGEHISAEKSKNQTKSILNHYKNKPFVYITHRINSYSVDPNIYHNTSQINTLLGFVVVSKGISSVKNAIYEKMFLDKPFEIFEDMEDGILWAEHIYNMKTGLQ